jgi:TBC1 domain family protein 5
MSRIWRLHSHINQIFLLFNTLDRSSWPTSLTDSRTAYDSLRSHFLRAIEHPDEIESVVDPLSENEEVLYPMRLVFGHGNELTPV